VSGCASARKIIPFQSNAEKLLLLCLLYYIVNHLAS